jgi:Domain of unknown function (DUF4173)
VTTTALPPPELSFPADGAPRPVLVTAGALGLAAAVVVPAGPPGVGLLLLGVATALGLRRLAPAPVRGWRAVHGLSALALLATVAVRDAPWVVTVCLLGALAVASLAVTGGRTWVGMARGAVDLALAAPRGSGWLGRGLVTLRPSAATAGPVTRGLALSAALLLVFGSLLASGDAVFAALLSRLVPDLPSTGHLPAYAVVLVVTAAAVAGAARLLLAPRPEPVLGPPARSLTRASEWLLPLAALDGLLLLWVGLQPAVLFGDAGHVLGTSGLSFAEHAREGFFQMVAVVVLVLAVVAAGVRWAPRSARPGLGLLCGLALLVDASAVHRLALYAEEFGLTRLRVATTTVALWLGVVLLLVLVAGSRAPRALPHLVVTSAVAGLLALVAANPDARIASSQLTRADQADLAYVATLSADAVPVLDRLTEPIRSCALAGRTGQVDGGWLSASVARERAADLLAARPVVPLTPLDCP